MRKLLLILAFTVAVFTSANSQNLSYSCPRDTILACGNPCLTITGTIPDIRLLTTDYTVRNVSQLSACYPIVDPGGPGPSTNLSIDDTYSDSILISFTFPFYGERRRTVVVSTNGYVTFDSTNALDFGSHWQNFGALPNTSYDRAIIMGPYHDLDPSEPTSPTQKVKYNVFGTAPNRKWIISFYRVPLFSCDLLIENTHQIILHESSGIVEVFIKDMEICNNWPTTDPGRAMVGMQNYARNKSITAPGRSITDPAWGSIGMNEMWRFVPKDGAPAYRSTQLLDGTGAVVATGDTTRVDAANFRVSFPNVCPPANQTSVYVIKTTYQSLVDPAATFFSLDTINVLRQNSLPIDTTTTPTDCGGATGTITATASGGTPPYQYSINFGPFQSSGLFTGLAQGVYNIVGIDASGCTDTIQVPITARANIPGSATQTPTGCPGVNNGTITVTTGGGAAPFTFSLDGGAPGNSNVITGVSAGPHTVVFTDANGCTGVVSITVGAGSSITSSAPVTTPATCAGSNNGSATINPTSGAGPYTYSLNGGTPQTSNTFTGLAGGNYSVLITDAAGCTGTRTFFVNTGAGISLAPATSTPESCTGAANGTITITPNNGTAPYTYTLDGGTPQASNVFTGVTSGFHTVVVRDANNCSATQSLPVSVGTGITATATSNPTACSGASNGSITVSVTPAGSYTYQLDGGTPQGTNIFTGVADGAHVVIVSAAGGCADTLSVTVAAGSNITATTASNPTSCPAVNNGDITVTPTNGTAPYQYSSDGTTFQASNTFTGLAAGSYTITIRDASGCTGTVTETVAAGTSLNGTATGAPSSCAAASNGSLTATVTNGTAPYTYSIDGTTFQASNTFTGLLTGNYTVTFRDASGCEGTASVTVGTGSGFTGTATETPASCPGVNNGSITVTPGSAGQAPFTYALDGGTSQSSGLFTGVSAGAHSVVITDAAGCTATVPISVSANSNISGTAATTSASCPGVNNGEVVITPGSTATAPFSYSLDGGASQASGTFTGISSGAHIVTITDGNGCSAPVNFTIGVGTAITGTTSNPIAASCAGVNNGGITIVPGSTATAPFTFSMDGGASQASGTFTGLSAGNHTATFTDANGCVGTVNFTTAAGGLLTGTYSEVPATCAAAANGSVTVTATSGSAPYLFSIDGGTPQASATFNNLAPGTYMITFTDGPGCLSDTITATVTAAAPLTLTATPVAASCPGVNNGSVTINPDPLAVAPFTFSVDGGAAQASPVFNGLASGAHTATFTDANGCPATVSFNIGTGAVITGTATGLVAASCPGVNNGEATITPGSAATAPFTFSVDGGTSQSSATFTGLSAGSHTATFTDANGCVGTVNFTIAAGGLLSGTFTEVPATCPDATNGSITVTPTAGTGPYLYSLDGGAPQTSATFSNLAPGSYTVTFTDGLGCLSDNIAATVTSAPALTVTATPVDATCPGVNNGSVTLNPDPLAVAPFTFSVDGGSPQASPVFNGLAPGSHTATFTDANGCPATVTFSIASGANLAADKNATPTSCPGVSNGTITVTPTTGAAPYQFSLDGGTPQASGSFTNLAPGSYTITFTDAIGCSGSVSETVTQGTSISSTVASVQPVCNGIDDGEITVTPTSGVGPYTYSLNGGTAQASPTFTSLAPGSYTILVTDGAGCTGNNNAILNTNPALSMSASNTDPSCFGAADGSIAVSVTGGVAPYEYSIDGGTTYQSSGTFENLNQGAYTITVRDNVGCTKAISESLVQPTQLSASAATTPSTCQGGDGTITITATGGTPNYLYSIDNGATYPFQSSNVFTVGKGNYTNIAVKDDKGCSTIISAVVGEVDVMGPLFIGNDTTVCQGQPVTFDPQVHPQATVFKWRENIYLDSDSIKNATAIPEDTTMYILTAQWGACQREDTIIVNVLLRPIPDAGLDQRICLNDSTTISGTVSHTSGPVTLVWSPADLVHDDSTATTIAVPGGTQTYTLTATDNYGCNFSVSDSVLIIMQPAVPAFAGGDTLVTVNLPYQLMGSGGVQYLWSTNSSVATIADPTVQMPWVTSSGDANFMLQVTDIAGCVGYDTVYVQVYQGPEYYVPNAFSPNGDGLNDVFRAIPVGMTRPEYFRVFNRFGELVFETNQYLKGWDGTYKGKLQPMGVYIWILKGEDRKGRKVEMKGTVMLVQ